MSRRRSILTGLLGFAGLSVVKSAVAAPDESTVSFSYKDVVINFNPATGQGNDEASACAWSARWRMRAVAIIWAFQA